jgi:hypothetical protein
MLDVKELAEELDDLRERRDYEPEEGDPPSDPLDDDEKERLSILEGLEKDLNSDLHVFAKNRDRYLIEDGKEFEDHARDLHEDIDGHDRAQGWPYDYIDWERAAEALQQDYTAVEFDGETYYYRE